ncbi:PHOsphatase, partial [Borealophlyctis nickersoniae]
KEVELLEYFEDMRHWWLLAYGAAINERVACRLITDVVDAVMEVVDAETESPGAGKGYRKGVFRFGHSETNVFLMTLLGLYNDTLPLTTANTPTLLHTRTFRLSHISPFATNIIFELVSCRFSSSATDSSSYKIRVVINERDTPTVPGCPDAWCPLDTFLSVVRERGVGCVWEDVCGGGGGGKVAEVLVQG